MKTLLKTSIISSFVFFAACNKNEKGNTITPVNTNNISAASISVSGGNLLSKDSSLLVTIPASAFSSPTTVSIEKTNTALPANGIGSVYKILPEGTTFATPATIKFTYTDAQLGSKSPHLLVAAFKNASGKWERISLKNSSLDIANKSFTVKTSHFSEWVLIASEGGINVEVDGRSIYDLNVNFRVDYDIRIGAQGITRISARDSSWDFKFLINGPINRAGNYSSFDFKQLILTDRNTVRNTPLLPSYNLVANNNYCIVARDSLCEYSYTYGDSFTITNYGAVNDYVTGYFEGRSVTKNTSAVDSCVATNYRFVPLRFWFQYRRLQ